MKETITVKPFGIVKDQAPQDVAAEWTNGENVIFEDGRTRKSFGYTVETDAGMANPDAILYCTDGNVDYWIFADISTVTVWNGTTFTALTPAGWSGQAGQITMCDINGFPVINHSGVGLFWWDFAGATLIAYPDWQAGWTCQAIRTAKQQLFALNVEDGSNYRGMYFRWSDAAAPGNVPQLWQPAADNLAGDGYLPHPEGKIIDGGMLRNDFVIYKENSSHIVRYVGGQFQWSIQEQFNDIGCLAVECLVQLENKHYVLTQDDLVVSDGVNTATVIDKAMKHYLFDRINPDLASRCYMIADKNGEQLYVGFPDENATAGCNRMLIYHYMDKVWTERKFLLEHYSAATGRYTETGVANVIWDNVSTAWDNYEGPWNPNEQPVSKNRVIIGAQAELWKLKAVDLDGGSTIPAKIEKTGIDLDAVHRQKHIQRVWLNFAEGNGTTVQVRVGAAQNPEDAPQYGPVYNFTIGSDRSVPAQAFGRVGAIQIESNANGHWALVNMELEVRPAGRF